MLNCKRTSVLVSQSLDRPLTWRERWAVRLHLLICVYCRRFAQQLQWIRRAMQGWQQQVAEDSEVALSQDARDRITQQLDKFY
ncbi:zf-HC2 domain-containing protein [Methylophilus medardicus]|uniref:Zf-HC2 domain-containing protein n=1 Tax=Methylophilus medardicus TaxID=2588534 RepID=A0A5B8CQJ2_9PROT|nr:zf-HC2 domain-containing protein [Methylophilus medardicus]QDC43479.1 zf-HC2 domain-containing protein [Methylophilus medardicus]QDC48486.1 zf-HC2 domain-containing protein [Methylophilus medardicus]QDC52191.1 zf-HC2 domain-containing protein [Methylophilus medardicus]